MAQAFKKIFDGVEKKGKIAKGVQNIRTGFERLKASLKAALPATKIEQQAGLPERAIKDKKGERLKRLIASIGLDAHVETVALENAADNTWLTKKAQGALKDRIREMGAWRNAFMKAAEELGWGETTKAKYAEALLSIVDISERAPYSRYGHGLRVFQITEAILERLPSLPDREKGKVKLAALIHDIGKAGVGNNLLRKEGMLSNSELAIMNAHAEKGFSIPKQIWRKFGGVDEGEFEEILKIARGHHERIDGLGYPDGIAGNSIPLGSRIICVADAFDSIVSDRAYRKGKTAGYALEAIKDEKGQFDSGIAELFLKIHITK